MTGGDATLTIGHSRANANRARATTNSVNKKPIGNGALHHQVQIAVRRYLKDMGSHDPEDLFQFVIEQVEMPLFSEVMDWTDGNQSRAAAILGINRGTLRKKLRQHGIHP